MRRPRPRRCGGRRASPRKRYCFQKDRRRLPEGERQHNRLQHHPLAAAAPEDRLGGDERRRPGSVPEQPGRDHCAVCLGRQAGRCDAMSWRRKSEEYTETALLTVNCYNNVEKKRSFYGVPYTVGCITEPYLAAAGREGRLQDRGHPEDLGCLLRFLQGACRRSCATRAMRHVYGLGFPGDHQRRRSQQRCSTIS